LLGKSSAHMGVAAAASRAPRKPRMAVFIVFLLESAFL